MAEYYEKKTSLALIVEMEQKIMGLQVRCHELEARNK